jgi:hypothetical protein
MFCINCGKKISEKDTFCAECGLEIEKERSTTENKQMRNKLEHRAWYRFLKVIYLLALTLSFVSIIGLAWVVKPERTLDGELSTIACDNGKLYAPAKNNIWTYGDTLDSTDDKHARILCKYDTLDFYNYRYSNEFIAKNYTFKPVYNEGDYGTWFLYVLVALTVTWLIFKVIKIAFFYIAIGNKPSVEDFKKFI